MSLLLDTHVLVWFARDEGRLPARVRRKILEHDGKICVSVVSGWEYGVKRAKFPHVFPEPFEQQLMPDYRRLGLDFDMHRHADSLPPIHTDPFDRMLIAQALDLDLTLVTADKIIRRYPVRTFW